MTLKNWFLLTSISCGVGFTFTLALSKNLQQSALAGLGTVPAIATSLTMLARQRKEEIERQISKSNLHLIELQKQEEVILSKLHSNQNSYEKIKYKCQELQLENTKIAAELDAHRKHDQELEKKRQLLLFQEKEYRSVLYYLGVDINSRAKTLRELDNSVNDRQKILEKVNVELTGLKASGQEVKQWIKIKKAYQCEMEGNITQSEERLKFILTQVDVLNRSLSEKRKLLRDLDLNSNTSDPIMEKDVAQSEGRLKFVLAQVDTLDRSLNEKQKLLRDLEKNIAQSEERLEFISTGLEIKQWIRSKKEYQREMEGDIAQSEEKLKFILTQVGILDRSLNEKQKLLGDLDLNSNDSQRSVNTSDTALMNSSTNFSESTENWMELVNIIKTRTGLEMCDIDSAKIGSVRDAIIFFQGVDSTATEWHENGIFKDNPHLSVLQYIEKHGIVTESEICHMLGNPRSVRKFKNTLQEYYKYLPFSIAVDGTSESYMKQQRK
jgi:chromosome segregation ATPase